jgi:iron complex outermembrane recepter protein
MPGKEQQGRAQFKRILLAFDDARQLLRAVELQFPFIYSHYVTRTIPFGYGPDRGITMKNVSGMMAALVVITMITAPRAHAQVSVPKGADQSTQIAEIIVTATKRAENLQITPMSITALTAQDLSSIGAQSFEDFSSYLAGISFIDTGGPSHQQIIIRGINTGSSSNATVGVLVDDVPFGSTGAKANGGSTTPDLDTFDLNRLEVLRGPQGTLYGALTMGGLIKYVPNAPDSHDFAAQVEAGASTVDHGSGGYDVKGMLNVPLSADIAAMRIVAYHDDSVRFISNLGNNRTDSFGYAYDGGRVSFLLTPTETLKVTLAALVQHINQTDQPIEDVNVTTHDPTYCDLCRSTPGLDRFKTQYELYSAKVDWDTNVGTLTSITSYSKLHQFIRNDFSEFLDSFIPIPQIAFNSDLVFDLNKTTQELRLTSPTAQRWEWLAGIYYDDERNTGPQNIYAYALPGGFVPPGLNPIYNANAPSTYREYAGFGDLTYHLTEQFDVTGGLRYSRNEQTFFESTSGAIAGPPESLSGSSSDNSVTYMFDARYMLTAQNMIYAHIASGYRPGGANLQVPPVSGAPSAPAQYGPDKLWNYELGTKTEWLNNRLLVDASIYWINWRDIQIQVLTPGGFAYYANAGAARSRGAELTTEFKPTAGLTLGLNAGYTDATLTSVPANANIGATAGDPLPHTPKWTAALTADQTFSLGRGLTGTVGGTYRYVGDQFEAFPATPGVLPFHMAGYSLYDLRAGIAGQKWTLTLFARNISDTRAQLRGFTEQAGASGRAQLYVNEPRNFKVVASMRF